MNQSLDIKPISLKKSSLEVRYKYILSRLGIYCEPSQEVPHCDCEGEEGRRLRKIRRKGLDVPL